MFEHYATMRELNAQKSTLTAACERARMELNRELVAAPGYYDQTAVREKRATLRRLENELADVEERLAAVSAQQPGDLVIASVRQHAEYEVERALAATRTFPDVVTRFLDALETAVAAGRDLVAIRTNATAASGAAKDLARNYDFSIDVPEVPTLSPGDARLLANLAAALVDLAAGDQPREVVETYLAAERARVAASV
jgi:hypothetical protein